MQVLWEEEREKVKRGLWQWQLYLPRRSAWGNQKWLTTTTASVAASRKWRFVKYLFADVAIVCLPLLPLLSFVSSTSTSSSRLLFNEFRKFFDAASHACERRAHSWLLLLLLLALLLLFAKFFSPTCLRIHDVQIIVSILKIPSDLCVLFVCAEWFAKGGTCKRLSRWMFSSPALPQALLREREVCICQTFDWTFLDS